MADAEKPSVIAVAEQRHADITLALHIAVNNRVTIRIYKSQYYPVGCFRTQSLNLFTKQTFTSKSLSVFISKNHLTHFHHGNFNTTTPEHPHRRSWYMRSSSRTPPSTIEPHPHHHSHRTLTQPPHRWPTNRPQRPRHPHHEATRPHRNDPRFLCPRRRQQHRRQQRQRPNDLWRHWRWRETRHF